MRTLVLDAGALIALKRRDRRAMALLDQVIRAQTAAHVPAGVVAQVWRGSERQHTLVRLLRAEGVRVHALDEDTAYRIGLLLAATGTSDVVDAHVAILGRMLRAVVVTSDADDLRRLDGTLDLISL